MLLAVLLFLKGFSLLCQVLRYLRAAEFLDDWLAGDLDFFGSCLCLLFDSEYQRLV